MKQYTLAQKLLIGIPCGLVALAFFYFGIWVVSVNSQIILKEIAATFK